ncbi:MAG: 4-alpha-glucanotransferase, partial [Paracoccaceae bacterium]
DVAAFDRRAGTGGGRLSAMLEFIAASASVLVALQIEDILGMEEQPNLPGTIHDHPNWRRRLPKGPAALADDEMLQQAAAIMARHGR